MYLNDANRNRVNCKSIQGTIEIWKDDSIAHRNQSKVFCPVWREFLTLNFVSKTLDILPKKI